MPTFSEALRTITSLPGARYCCIAEQPSGTVLEERGERPPWATPVIEWGRIVAESPALHGDLQDLAITGGRHYHLLRRIRVGDPAPLLGYLCLDRAGANLAQARLALSALRPDLAGSVPAQALPPARETIPDRAPGPTRLPTRTPRTSVAHPAVALAPATRPAPPAPGRPDPGTRSGSAPDRGRPEGPGGIGRTGPALAGEWSNDLYVMRRLLNALRRLD